MDDGKSSLNKDIILPATFSRLNLIRGQKECINVAFNITGDAVIKGKIVWDGALEFDEKANNVYGIITNYAVNQGTNGKFGRLTLFKCESGCGILANQSMRFLHIDDDGTIKYESNDKMIEVDGKYPVATYVSVTVNENVYFGQVVKIYKINDILCYQIDLKGFQNSNISMNKSVIVLENDITAEIKNPNDYNVHTYFKLGAFVKTKKKRFGVVKTYIVIDNTFYFLVEIENKLVSIGLEDILSGVKQDLKGKKFLKVDDPNEYGIVTKWKKGSTVEIKLSDVYYPGFISWMGFDGDDRFKFGITLDGPYGHNEGTFCGETLFRTDRMCAALVTMADIRPDVRFAFEEKREINPTVVSEIVNECQHHLYKIKLGKYKGIQGNLNSCYLDTSIFAIFAFNSFLDNMLYEEVSDKSKEELQQILKTHLVYPLRKSHHVSFDKVTVFREKLQKLFPNGKFLANERDPEELLETLFHLVTPQLFLLRTKLIRDETHEQKCFMTQLFYQVFPEKLQLSVLEMLNLTFIESEMLISNPPRALILQLPRHGREMKKFDTVSILPKLDITSLIAGCSKCCSYCSKHEEEKYMFKENVEDIYICKECSIEKYSLIYCCGSHKTECNHEKMKIQFNCEPYRGNVILELTAILCIEKTHYVSYVKTNEVKSTWLYFNSMEELENGEFIPVVRETTLGEYFDHGLTTQSFNGLKNPYSSADSEKIERYAFVCFYKNPAMEFYCRDFNSES